MVSRLFRIVPNLFVNTGISIRMASMIWPHCPESCQSVWWYVRLYGSGWRYFQFLSPLNIMSWDLSSSSGFHRREMNWTFFLMHTIRSLEISRRSAYRFVSSAADMNERDSEVLGQDLWSPWRRKYSSVNYSGRVLYSIGFWCNQLSPAGVRWNGPGDYRPSMPMEIRNWTIFIVVNQRHSSSQTSGSEIHLLNSVSHWALFEWKTIPDRREPFLRFGILEIFHFVSFFSFLLTWMGWW